MEELNDMEDSNAEEGDGDDGDENSEEVPDEFQLGKATVRKFRKVGTDEYAFEAGPLPKPIKKIHGADFCNGERRKKKKKKKS